MGTISKLILFLLLASWASATDVETNDQDGTTTTADDEVNNNDTATSQQCHGRLALVTGGTGQTGRIATRLLLEQHFCVRILTRNLTKAQETFANDNDQHSLLEFVEGALGDGKSVPAAFAPRHDSSAAATISHVLFAAGGEDADFEAVNSRGVAECAREAVRAGSKSMVVVSAAWVSKPYSLASILFNSLYDNLPMAKHLQGENILRQAVGFQRSSLNYVILRAGRLVPDAEYPNDAPKGLWLAQGDSFGFFGPAGMPGMCHTQLAHSMVTALKVEGKYTVEITSGTTPYSAASAYASLKQDGVVYESHDDVDRIHGQAIKELNILLRSLLVGAVLFCLYLGWKWGLLVSFVVSVACCWFWYQFWSDLSVRSLVVK